MIETRSNRRILGVDPGLARIGWGVIDHSRPSLEMVAFGSLQTSPATSHPRRLLEIYQTLEEVIEEHQPEVVAVEEIFQGKSVRSALKAGEGRGVCILAGARAGLEVHEYAATVVKSAVTGNGQAAKTQVQAMVCRLLGLSEIPQPHDAADALAIAITHFQRRRGRSLGIQGGAGRR